MKPDLKTFVDRLRALARTPNRVAIQEELGSARTEDLAKALVRVPVEEGFTILSNLDPVDAADLLVELPTETARQYLAQMPDSTLAHYLDILPTDDAIELHEELGEERFEALLQVIPRRQAQKIRQLLAYPEGTVGRLTTEAFFEIAPDQTMVDVLADIRRSPEDKYESVNDLYVLDEDRHLVGVFSLRKAIRARPDATAREIMNTEVISVLVDSPAEDAARQMARYGLYALPVLDHRGRMIGIFTGDDAQSIIREADTEDVLRLGGVSGDADAYLALNIFQLAKRRVFWLFALFIAETFTGSVMRYYAGGTEHQELLTPVTFAIPLLIGAGGNSGSQTTTTITRALAVGEISTSDALLVLSREFGTSFIVGCLLGGLGYLNAFYRWHMAHGLSVAIALSLPAIIVWSTCIGSLLPITAKRLGIDPAVMSAPFISTFVDATGLVIYFEIVRRLYAHG